VGVKEQYQVNISNRFEVFENFDDDDLNINRSWECTEENTLCSYEVPGMVLLRDLMGAKRLDCSKNMSVHVSAFIIYDFKALTPLVWKLWR
jgi:hypothetical protein